MTRPSRPLSVALLALPALLPAALVRAAPAYVARLDVPGFRPSHALAADVDGDGNQDLVAVTQSDSKLKVFYGRGDGTFRFPAEIYATDVNPVFVAVGDLTPDGRTSLPDILVVALHGRVQNFNLIDGDLAVFENSGMPPGSPDRFASSCPDIFLDGSGQQNGNQPNFALLDDFNNDARLDVVATSAFGNKLQTFFQGFSNATGSCLFPQICDLGFAVYRGPTCTPLSTGQTGPEAVASGSFAPRVHAPRDVAALNQPPSGPAYVTYHFHTNANTDGFLTLNQPPLGVHLYQVGDGATRGLRSSMMVADRLDADAIPDLLVSNTETGDVSVLRALDASNLNAPFFAQPSLEYPAGADATWVATGEFPAGAATAAARDAVVSNRGIDAVSLLPGVGDGSFVPPLTFPAANAPVTVATGDFNNDTVPDLAVANEESNSLSVMLGRAAPEVGFDLAPRRRTGGWPIAAVAGQFNAPADAFPDAAFLNGDTASVAVLLGRENPADPGHTDARFEEVATRTPVGAQPAAMAAGRFVDGEPSDGVAVVSSLPGELRILLPVGDGSLRIAGVLPLPDGASAVVAAPLDAGPTVDLAVALPGLVRLFRGAGDGSFAPLADVPVGGSPAALVAAAVNTDASPDLVVLDAGGAAVRALLNDGSGSFTLGAPVPTGALQPNGLAAADLSGDSAADLVVTHGDGNVVAHTGDGAGGFAARPAFQLIHPPSAPLVGEFTGSAGADVALVINETDLVLVFPWSPSASNLDTAAGVSYGTGIAPRTAVAGAFDSRAAGLDTILVGDRSDEADGPSVTVLAGRRHPVYPPADAGPDRAICGAGAAPLGTPAQPFLTYSWSPSAGLQPAATVAQPTATLPGTYTLTVSTDPRIGLSATDTVTVTSAASPVVAITPDPAAYCLGAPPLVLDAGAGFSTYLWSSIPAGQPGDGASSRTIAVDPSTTTTYTAVVSNSAGCTGQGSRTVTVSAGPAIDASVTPELQCAQSPTATFVADASRSQPGGLAFSWSLVGATGGWTVVSPSAAVTDVTATPAATPAVVTLRLVATLGGCSATRDFRLELLASGAPADVGNSLRATKGTAPDVTLSWSLNGSPSYDVHSVTDPAQIPSIFAGAPDATVAAPPVSVAAPEPLRFFQVRGQCP